MPRTVACKCPNCGAAVTVPPRDGVSRCGHCGGVLQFSTDEAGRVSVSLKHISVHGGTVQIADNVNVVEANTTVRCRECGRNNLKHHTFRCPECRTDDLCVEHQTKSGACVWCRDERVKEREQMLERRAEEEARLRAEERLRRQRQWVNGVLVAAGLASAVAALAAVTYALAQISCLGWVIILAAVLGGLAIGGAIYLAMADKRRQEMEDEQ